MKTGSSSKLPELLLTPVAVAALLLSASGIWGYATHTLGLTGGRQLVAVLGLDAAIFVCAVLARRNKLDTGSRGAYGLTMWALAGVSALLASLEATSLEGQLGRAAFPFVAAGLWELLTSYRHREAHQGPDRRVGLVRWLHPVERVRVMLELATDTSLSEAEGTYRVRVRAAAWRLHRIAQLPEKGLRFRVANRRAGAALSRVGSRDPGVHRDVVAECYEIASPHRVGQQTVTAAVNADTVTPAQVFTRAANVPVEDAGTSAEAGRNLRAEAPAPEGGSSDLPAEGMRNVPAEHGGTSTGTPGTFRRNVDRNGRNLPAAPSGSRAERSARKQPETRKVEAEAGQPEGGTSERKQPDITALIPVGQELYRQLYRREGHVTRSRLVQEHRDQHGPLSGDRASALWQALNNGHAPVID